MSTSFMDAALALAREAFEADEVPVGALIVHSATGRIIAGARNESEHGADPTAHAEILAIRRAAAALGQTRLLDCDLYVTLEPCPMCAQAIAFARIRRVYFGAYDPKGGGVEHGPRIFQQPTCHHRPEVYGGMQDAECGRLLKDFFMQKRT